MKDPTIFIPVKLIYADVPALIPIIITIATRAGIDGQSIFPIQLLAPWFGQDSISKRSALFENIRGAIEYLVSNKFISLASPYSQTLTPSGYICCDDLDDLIHPVSQFVSVKLSTLRIVAALCQAKVLKVGVDTVLRVYLHVCHYCSLPSHVYKQSADNAASVIGVSEKTIRTVLAHLADNNLIIKGPSDRYVGSDGTHKTTPCVYVLKSGYAEKYIRAARETVNRAMAAQHFTRCKILENPLSICGINKQAKQRRGLQYQSMD